VRLRALSQMWHQAELVSVHFTRLRDLVEMRAGAACRWTCGSEMRVDTKMIHFRLISHPRILLCSGRIANPTCSGQKLCITGGLPLCPA